MPSLARSGEEAAKGAIARPEAPSHRRRFFEPDWAHGGAPPPPCLFSRMSWVCGSGDSFDFRKIRIPAHKFLGPKI